MKIERIETFQVQWEEGSPYQRSAFVRIWTDDGLHGIGEASPMQGGIASLMMIQHDIAPALIGADPLDHAVQHYHIQAMGEVAQRLSITVSAGEQTYTLAGLAELIVAGVRMIQPDIVKMGGITGLQRCAALAHSHGVELVSHQTQPTVGHMANMHVVAAQLHATKPIEWNDPSERMHSVFDEVPKPDNGLFRLSERPGLGMDFIEDKLAGRRIDVTA